MTLSTNLRDLIDAVAPYWAGEAEVFRAYWTWNRRTRDTDRKWLAHQCFKEIWGLGLADKKLGLFLGPVEELRAAFPKIDISIDRHEVLDIAEGLRAEFAHYVAFADAWDGLRDPGMPKLNPTVLTWWKEDEELSAVRYGHRDQYGELGMRAVRFTEGGYCTLFAEGMALAKQPTHGHEDADRLIAKACGEVYDDEFGHMLKGIVGFDRENMPTDQWQTLARLSIEQMQGRIHMRNAQFSYPLSGEKLANALTGRCTPLKFDYERAGLVR